MTLPERARKMAERTLSGEAKEGFFIPYRHAASVQPPAPYPAFEALFSKAEPEFRAVLAEIEAHATELRALNGPPAPALGSGLVPPHGWRCCFCAGGLTPPLADY